MIQTFRSEEISPSRSQDMSITLSTSSSQKIPTPTGSNSQKIPTGRSWRRQKRKQKRLQAKEQLLRQLLEKRRASIAQDPDFWWCDAFKRLQAKKITPAEYRVYFQLILETYLEKYSNHQRVWHETYLELSQKSPEDYYQNRDFLERSTLGFLPKRSFIVQGTLHSPVDEVQFHSADWYISEWSTSLVMFVRLNFPTRIYWTTLRFEKGVVYHFDVPYLLVDIKFSPLSYENLRVLEWSIKPTQDLLAQAVEWESKSSHHEPFLEVVVPKQFYYFDLKKLGNVLVKVNAVERDERKVILIVTTLQGYEYNPISMMVFSRQTCEPSTVLIFCDTPFGTITEQESEYTVERIS